MYSTSHTRYRNRTATQTTTHSSYLIVFYLSCINTEISILWNCTVGKGFKQLNMESNFLFQLCHWWALGSRKTHFTSLHLLLLSFPSHLPCADSNLSKLTAVLKAWSQASRAELNSSPPEELQMFPASHLPPAPTAPAQTFSWEPTQPSQARWAHWESWEQVRVVGRLGSGASYTQHQHIHEPYLCWERLRCL